MPESIANIYGAVVGACWLVFLVSWAIFASVLGGGAQRQQSAKASAFRLIVVIALFVALRYGNLALQTSVFGPYARDVAAAGAALCVAGVAFAIWARVTLGRNWGMPMTLHADPELVTSGPYRLVRHPIYTGLTAMLIGTALVYPFTALPCTVIIAYSLYSARREERDMQQRFPDAYPDYKKRSKMLVPFVL